jgi:predicted small secreted protein
MVRKIILAISISAIALTAAACNTVRGAGRDLESVADDVDEAI